MATYDEIHGKRIKEFSSDPTLNSSYEGQVWYNSSSGNLKSVVSFASWSSGPNVNTARINGSASGIQTAAVFAGGNAPPYSTATEEYNGTGFEVGGNMNDNRDPYAGFGTLTDTVTAGGYDGSNKAESETYNGTSWSEGNNLNTARRGQQGFGTSGDAGVCCGGFTTTASTATEEYDGTNWTTVNSMPTARYSGCAVGAQTSGIQVAGDPGSLATSFEYDGTNWSSGGALSAGRSFIMLGGATQDAVIAFGGETSPGAITTSSENYDGTSWTTGTSTGTGHKNISCGGWGTKTATFAAFGNGPPGGTIATTEEYNISINTITPGAWASGGNLNQGRQDVGGVGTKTAGLAFGGRIGPAPTSGPFTPVGNSEEYDGTSWTEGNNLNTARGEASGAGTQGAAVAFGGDPTSNATENYDGTSWTTSPGTLNSGRSSGASFGASYTSAVFCGGYGGSPAVRTDVVEEWNGSIWANATSMPEARYNGGGAGIENAGIVMGGSNAPGGTVVFTSSIEYDGSNWTTGGTNPFSTEGQGMNGTQTACIAYGGDATLTVNSSVYDGTTWVTNPSLAANRSALGASKGASIGNSMGAGGSSPGDRMMNNTEEFTQAVETATAKNLASS